MFFLLTLNVFHTFSKVSFADFEKQMLVGYIEVIPEGITNAKISLQ